MDRYRLQMLSHAAKESRMKTTSQVVFHVQNLVTTLHVDALRQFYAQDAITGTDIRQQNECHAGVL